MSDRRKLPSTGGPNSKRARHDDFGNSSSSFEEELALFNTIESESDFSQKSQSQESQDSINGSSGTHNVVAANRNKWSRPDPPKIDPSKESLIFQQLDIDNYIGEFFTIALSATTKFFNSQAWRDLVDSLLHMQTYFLM